jgi:branched-chain amino acid transport system substrate-binding protein
MRRRSLITLTAAVSTMGLLSACGGSALDEGSGGGGGKSAAATIGLLVPKSGVYAPLGTDMENGFKLYLKEKGNKLGGKDITVKLVDEGGGPDAGVPAGQGLANDESVSAVVGVVNSAVALGLRDAFEEAKKPLVIANAGADDITGKAASDYVWRTSFANSEVSSAIGKTVAEQTKGGSVFLVGPDYAAGKEFLGGFQKTFTAAGGKVAGEQMTPFGKTTNFQPYLAAIEKSGAKAAFTFYAGAEAVAFVKQFNELGLSKKVQLYASGFLTEGSVLKAQGEAAKGIKTSLHYSSELDNPKNKTFVAAYEKEYGSSPTVYSVASYDAAQALDKAFAKGIKGDEIVAGLKSIDSIDSPRGAFSFTPTHGPKQTYYLRTVTEKDGKLVNVVDGPLSQ